MWIEKTKNKKYKYGERFYNPYTRKYQKVCITLDRKNDRQAFQLLDKKINEKLCNENNTDITIKEALKEYLSEKESTVKPSTFRVLKTTETILRSLPNNFYIKNVNTYVYKNLINNYKGSKASAQKLIKIFFHWCYSMDYIENINFLSKGQKHKAKKREKEVLFLETAELKRILEELDACEGVEYSERVYRYMLEFQSLTGLRVGELLALEENDVKKQENFYILQVVKTLDNNTFETQIPKTKESNREIAINKRCIEIIKSVKVLGLERRLQGCNFNNKKGLLFPSSRGNYIRLPAYNNFLKGLTPSITSHTLRHTHASMLSEQGISLEAIQRRLGHESDQITKKIYIHITEKQKQKECNVFSNLELL